jgi:phospholipase/lecithinase/hemolysin
MPVSDLSTSNLRISAQTANRADSPAYQLFAFGDSLSDIGRLFSAAALPPSPPYFNGRFSNGPVAVETLATELGLQLSLATDFAIGGAQTGRTNINDTDTRKVGGLLDQVDQFKTQASSLGAGPEDLYVVWAGANDFLNITPTTNPLTVLAAAVANTTTAVTALAQAGAKNIVVAKTPNLGRVPISLQANLLESLTQLSNSYNATLENSLDQLESSLGNVNIILADLFTTSETIAQNPTQFGFTNITEPFLNGLTPTNPTADPNQYFFWDVVHPTTRAHSFFANTFRSATIAGIEEDLTRNGTAGNDILVGYSGDDALRGLAGADRLAGSPGNDRLLGGAQNDILLGGGNRDTLIGEAGQDQLRGGLGADQFVYTDASHGRDTILDFQIGKDRIDLKAILNRRGYADSERFDAYVRLTSTSSGTLVRVDSNGDQAGGFRALALLPGTEANELTAASFLVS